MNQSERRIFLIQELLNERENENYGTMSIPREQEDQKLLLRGLMNVRVPKKINPRFLQIQDEYLRTETEAKGIVELEDLHPVKSGIYLWQGDITTLRCDAIVNAANL